MKNENNDSSAKAYLLLVREICVMNAHISILDHIIKKVSGDTQRH